MNGPSSEIHLREAHKLTSKSEAAGSWSSLSSAAEGNATAGTCHHVSSRARDDSSAERWGCAGTLAAVEKWVWLRKCMYGLSGELAVLLPALPTAPLPQQQLSPTSAAKCHRVPTEPCSQGAGVAVAGRSLGWFSPTRSPAPEALPVAPAWASHTGASRMRLSEWGLHVSPKMCPWLSLSRSPQLQLCISTAQSPSRMTSELPKWGKT